MAAAAAAHAGGTVVYVANADSQEISVLALDAATGALSPVEVVAVGGAVMPMALSPDKRVLYAALRSQPYRVVSFAIDPANGRLKKLGEAALADSMANIDTDRSGRWLFAASYGGHKVTVNAIGADGVVGAVEQLLPTPPNAHAIHVDAANRTVLSTSLGGDRMMLWRFDAAAGRLAPADPAFIATPAKSGPRHFVFDAAQRHLYLVDELDAQVHVYAYDGAQPALRELQVESALPPGFDGKPWAADLHLTPDGRWLYVSERTSSTLAAFRVDPASGLLQPAGYTPTEKTPRGFAITPSGRYVLAAGQASNAVTAYAIDAASGALAPVAHATVGKNPNWIEIVDLP
jgi:6-phosphogluconolactonase